MEKEFKVDIGGELRTLEFNNFSSMEIARILFKDDPMSSNPYEVMQKLGVIAENNIMLLLKVLVYAGIVGYDYKNKWETNVTQEEVGEWVAVGNLSQLVGIWKIFLEWAGNDIPKEMFEGGEGREEGTEKKS